MSRNINFHHHYRGFTSSRTNFRGCFSPGEGPQFSVEVSSTISAADRQEMGKKNIFLNTKWAAEYATNKLVPIQHQDLTAIFNNVSILNRTEEPSLSKWPVKNVRKFNLNVIVSFWSHWKWKTDGNNEVALITCCQISQRNNHKWSSDGFIFLLARYHQWESTCCSVK